MKKKNKINKARYELLRAKPLILTYGRSCEAEKVKQREVCQRTSSNAVSWPGGLPTYQYCLGAIQVLCNAFF